MGQIILALQVELFLAGIGSDLYTYHVQTGDEILCYRDALPNTNIHILTSSSPNGIDTDRSLICLAGSKYARIANVLLSGSSCSMEFLRASAEFCDWILAAHWLWGDGSVANVAMALAHNIVLLWDWMENVTLQRVTCEEKCILYSAHFLPGHTWSTLHLAAGTVFNQVVIWSVNGQTNSDGDMVVLRRLTGHDGVIFGIDYHAESSTLCSVSDDRTVRVWREHLSRESDDSTDARYSFQLHKILQGHSSRVWEVKITNRNIISVGEDAVCCVWEHSGKLTRSFSAHKGMNIWSSAVGPNGENMGDVVRSVAMQDYNTIYAMTNHGLLIQHKFPSDKSRLVMDDSAFSSYSLLVADGTDMVAVGNIHGSVRVYRDLGDGKFESCEMHAYQRKVLSLIWLNPTTLLTSGPNGQIHTWSIDTTAATSFQLVLEKAFVLPYCRQRWVTAATLTPDCRLLLCGDKRGTIHVYNYHYDFKDNTPIQMYPSIHGKSGVTYVCCRGDRVFSCGRDGHYRQFKINSGHVDLLNSSRIMKGMDWVHSLEFSDDRLYAHGFIANQFVIWSVDDGVQQMSITCGGGHRSWGCKVKGHGVRFVFVKASDVWQCTAEVEASYRILRASVRVIFLGRVLQLYS